MFRVKIIAEAGVNHNGSPELAFRLVDAAKTAGADVVKFQAFQADSLVSEHAPKADYQVKTARKNESQLEMLRKLELAPEVFHALANYCAEREIAFLAAPFDDASIRLLESMNLSTFKIPSGEITNLPYLRKIGGLGKKIILSTGMSTLEEVGQALAVLEGAGADRADVTLLHCTTEYPAPVNSVNLLAMYALREAFPGIGGVGYSDHTAGIIVPIAAASLGAVVLEKHFTLDTAMPGPDHKASLNPETFARMVAAVRDVERALGDGNKTPAPSELSNVDVVRKSIVAARAIRAGEIFSPDNLTVKRPGTGLSPMLWDMVVGTTASRDYAQDESLEQSILP